jgi:hypothetical protein
MAKVDNEQSAQTIAQRLTSNLKPADAKVETTEEEIEIEESEDNIQTDTKIENSLVTEELAIAMNLPKGFIGKPLLDVGKSYRSSLSWANDNNKKLIDLEKKLETIQEQLTAKEQTKADETAAAKIESELGEIPDPVEDKAGFNKWMLAFKAQAILEATKMSETKSNDILKNSLENNPQLKQAEEIAAQNTWKNISDSIQSSIPKDMKAEDVLNAFFEDVDEEDLYIQVGKEKVSIYDGKPKKFVNDVLTWLKSQSYDSLKNQKESDIIKKIQKKTKENLERANPKNSLKTNIINRKPDDDDKKETIAGRLAAKLQASARLRTG